MERVESLDGHLPFRRSERKKSREKKSLFLNRFPPLLESAGMESERSEGPDAGRFAGADGGSLVEFLDAVHEEGERLKERPTLANIRRYRQAVQGFLKRVLKKMLAVDEKTSGTSVLRRKRFTQIKVIDQKLERLVAEVLSSQARQLDILARVDEIHGLLVDLLT